MNITIGIYTSPNPGFQVEWFPQSSFVRAIVSTTSFAMPNVLPSKRYSGRASSPHLKIAILFSSFMLCTVVHADSAGCAPASAVSIALNKANGIVSKELGPQKARILLEILQRKELVLDGKVCFLKADFADFGRIVAQFLDVHMSQATRFQSNDDTPSFAQVVETKNDYPGRCPCLQCPAGQQSWCPPMLSYPKCCSRLCVDIFSTISVGALTGLEGSGVDACCEVSAKPCPSRQKSTGPAKQHHPAPMQNLTAGPLPSTSPVSSSDVPEFNFGASRASEPAPATASPTLGLGNSSSFRVESMTPSLAPSFSSDEFSASGNVIDRPTSTPEHF